MVILAWAGHYGHGLINMWYMSEAPNGWDQQLMHFKMLILHRHKFLSHNNSVIGDVSAQALFVRRGIFSYNFSADC